MADTEKVSKGLECCTKWDSCNECPYETPNEYDVSECTSSLHKEALELLKEQEAKKGQWIPVESPTGIEAFGVKEMTVMNVRCSVCGSEEDVSFTGYKYCPRCGAKMEGR